MPVEKPTRFLICKWKNSPDSDSLAELWCGLREVLAVKRTILELGVEYMTKVQPIRASHSLWSQ